MKKLFCICLALLFLLCGCGKASENEALASTTTATTTNSNHTPGSSDSTTGTLTDQSDSSDTSGSTTGSTDNDPNVSGTTTQTTTQNSTGSPTSGGSTSKNNATCSHRDANNDEVCDVCHSSVVVLFDFYAINDLHGKLADTDSNIGVDELTTYLKAAQKTDDNAILLSTGDMWQGSSESNMTKGKILVDWMNELGFAAMSLGNHEFDWGEEYIAENAKLAEFPFLAINIYDRTTNALVDFCKASVMVEGDGIQVGIIGAIGDCYSSIAVDKCDEVYFKTGSELTGLVKKEAERLRAQGADVIVYLLHDGYGQSSSGNLTSSQMSSYYDTSLSNGYVDLVFEGHTHQGYRILDEHGVVHLQNRGDNKGGISHAEIAVNAITGATDVRVAELVSTYVYQDLDDDPIVERLLETYKELIDPANRVLGYNNRYRNSSELMQLIARLYYEVGEKTWGDKYDIVLGGGFMSARSPYNLYTGEVTYANLQSIFPFDNQLTLCSIKGRYLRSKFLETSNDRYYIHCGDYGESIRNNIDPNATYYLITDSYSAYYKANQLTVIAEYDPTVFARDLLAEYIEQGGLA